MIAILLGEVVGFSVALVGFSWLKRSQFLKSPPPSGIQRHSEDYFDAAGAAVARAVRAVLARHPSYRETTEVHENAFFKTNVKPRCLGWLALGTEMTIELQPSFSGTNVIVTTKSQWYITDDIFNMYKRYIRDFLRDLHNEMHVS